MSNYALGAENDKNAPYNKEELKGETIGLFEYLENLELPYEIRSYLVEFDKKRQMAIFKLNLTIHDSNNEQLKKELYKIKKLLSEPQIFIENE